jgi:hypothetical protein
VEEGARVQRRAYVHFFWAGLAAIACGAAQAADVSRCVTIDDAAARLACYDSVAGRTAPRSSVDPIAAAPTAGSPTAPVAVAAATGTAVAAAASAPAQDAEQTFGLSAEKLVARQDPGVDELRARVSKVANHPRPGRWVVTLDNGQVWEQREAGAESRRPRPGDEVTIRKASLGSFLMAVSGRGTFRVSRVK